ncbi:MAG TPA: CoA transferase [Steroidobacteraceae bacterium]|nr:CoA transferase [Steroidobacteraceae bacterium]HRX90045.1 CoA transferase [Steroidobacteraceae bacterium]
MTPSDFLPLTGIRILTFENFGAGPFGSMYLADLGAEVIKIENRQQGGDATRRMGPYYLGSDDSHFFQTFNLNKKSVTLNLKTPDGQDVFHKLVGKSDAVLNNLRGDQPEKLGLTYDALKAYNPKIVCAHLSAYGRDNERKAWPGYDYLMQAEAGYLHLTGEPGSPPSRMGLSIIDFMTGITTALALVAALFGTSRSGVGRDLDVSLFDVALHQLSYPGNWYLNEGARTGRLARSSHPSATPVQLYKTQDGWIFIMCMTEKFWQALLPIIGRADLGAEARFATADVRRANRDALTPILDAEFERDTTANWLTKLQGILPAAPVYDMAQALDNPFLARIGALQVLQHPQRPDFRALTNPIKLDGRRLPSRVASALGADTRDILGELGLSQQDLDALAAKQVI